MFAIINPGCDRHNSPSIVLRPDAEPVYNKRCVSITPRMDGDRVVGCKNVICWRDGEGIGLVVFTLSPEEFNALDVAGQNVGRRKILDLVIPQQIAVLKANKKDTHAAQTVLNAILSDTAWPEGFTNLVRECAA